MIILAVNFLSAERYDRSRHKINHKKFGRTLLLKFKKNWSVVIYDIDDY